MWALCRVDEVGDDGEGKTRRAKDGHGIVQTTQYHLHRLDLPTMRRLMKGDNLQLG